MAFAIDRESGVGAEWAERRELLISFDPHGQIVRRESRVAGVAVSYRQE